METNKTIKVSKDYLTSDRNKILRFAESKFLKEGFYKTSVDEIARELGVSKNTIYKYFPTKNLLLESVVENVIGSRKQKIKEIIRTDKNAIEKFVSLLIFLNENLNELGPKFFRDAQIHNPALWIKIDSMREKLMYANLSKVIEQGKKEKLIRDFPSQIILRIFISSLRSVVNPEFIMKNHFSLEGALDYTFTILLEGVLSKKGLSLFHKSKRHML